MKGRENWRKEEIKRKKWRKTNHYDPNIMGDRRRTRERIKDKYKEEEIELNTEIGIYEEGIASNHLKKEMVNKTTISY